MTGLSGLPYGPVSVGGAVNDVLKRPTASPLFELGFRRNGLIQGGENVIDDSR